jgi:hypothetical protein
VKLVSYIYYFIDGIVSLRVYMLTKKENKMAVSCSLEAEREEAVVDYFEAALLRGQS